MSTPSATAKNVGRGAWVDEKAKMRPYDLNGMDFSGKGPAVMEAKRWFTAGVPAPPSFMLQAKISASFVDAAGGRTYRAEVWFDAESRTKYKAGYVFYCGAPGLAAQSFPRQRFPVLGPTGGSLPCGATRMLHRTRVSSVKALPPRYLRLVTKVIPVIRCMKFHLICFAV
jgi:hypothetical protein